ncbi:MAG: LysM peptidoglycan-binding domain-containing protein [Saprospiraceae bacterium]|nr:LysM peptidoglycan-binding domain-containing protein [Saprospiraceae bacterium]MDW8230963.1 LysM peptidoglycan-binding domain-containing protein [Saprospiraceae bacterium]
MRQAVLLFALSTLGSGFIKAQPIYIQFDPKCMNQLEYRYVYTGAVANAYLVQPTASEQIQLQAGNQGITSPTLPPNMVSCKNFKFDDQFFNDVNNLSRQVYMVHTQAKGYLLIPIISAAQILRSGQYYLVRARNYSFAVDTTNLVYENNIATGSSDWYIYFNGLKFRGCYFEYSFKREPTRANQERSEFDFIPGIGLTYERTGMTAAEAENNHYRLVKVNNLPLEDFINQRCGGRTAPTPPPVSSYTPQVEYGTIRETDKETYSLPGQQPTAPGTAGTSTLPPLADCPEPPGEGYHIVQPGETLNAISRAYNIPVRSLIDWNQIKNPNRINVCQKIWLRKPPAGAQPSAPRQTTPPTASVAPGKTGLPVAQRQDIYWGQAQGKGTQTPPKVQDVSQPQTPPVYTPQSKTIVHTVQSGETLFGIATRYGISEAEVRRLNKYPPTGPVNLQPGMQILVSDCCPPGSTAQPKTAEPPATTPPSGGAAPIATTPPGAGLPSVFNTQPTAPATYSQPNETQPAVTPTKTTPTYFQEYIVRDGDTIQSIAIRFKVNAQELAILNNKDVNETLIAGQRLLIPRN